MPEKKSGEPAKRRIAIACQGGGSHTAFTAGALKTILDRAKEVEIVALSGTSGGAICALLAWYGLLGGDEKESQQLLDTFWERNSASRIDEAWLNSWIVWGTRLKSLVPMPEISPYSFYPWAQMELRSMLEELVDFESIPTLTRPDSLPLLLVGAADVLSGEFREFKNDEIGVDQIIASTAVPSLFPAVQTEQSAYWDGLFSQNPPVCNLTEAKPDEIWVIRVNPRRKDKVPKTLDDIKDRRNELAGNLSLNQELGFIRRINRWLKDGTMVSNKYKQIEIKEIELDIDLDYSSKLDRSPDFIGRLMTKGEEDARTFFQ